MTLLAAAHKLYDLLAPHAVLIGGVCAVMHGVERFTRDVDLATELSPEQVVELLTGAHIDAEVRRSNSLTEPLPWVISGCCDGVDFQILPAQHIGVNISHAMIRVELGCASVEDFIASKCMAGGQQDLHDVAVMVLQQPALSEYAMTQATQHHCSDKLNLWLTDKRLTSRYRQK